MVWKIAGFQQVILYRIVLLADGCADAWNARNPLTAILCARAVMETSALVLDFERQLRRLYEEGDFPAIDALVMNRTFSTRMKDWQEQAPGVAAVNVLTAIEKLDDAIAGARKAYDILSEMCHPNSLGHNFMFGSLDTETATVHLRGSCFNGELFDNIFGGFVLVGLTERSLNEIDELLPKVLQLQKRPNSVSSKNREGRERDNARRHVERAGRPR